MSAEAAAARGVFSRRTVFWLAVVGVVCFLGSMALLLSDSPREDVRRGGQPAAVSALGHRAFIGTLRRLGVPVLVSRFQSDSKVGSSGLLFVGEPLTLSRRGVSLSELMRAPRVIVVLPKWRGSPHERNPRWIDKVSPLSEYVPLRVLRAIEGQARIVRPKGTVTWFASALGNGPSITAPQLISSTRLRPVVASDQGILIGETTRGRSRVWVVSDPDIFANHGLGNGENARFAVGLVRMALPAGGAVVVDATMHDGPQSPSLWGNLFDLPFVVATLAGVALVVVLAWAGLVRFGAPLREAPPLAAGKVTLIENATRLLQYGGQQRDLLDRYRRAAVAEIARRLHAPVGAGDAPLARWLDRVGATRGAAERYSDIMAEIDGLVGAEAAPDRRLVDAAARLYRWKQEMVHGS